MTLRFPHETMIQPYPDLLTELSNVFCPRSLAVVGATERMNSVGRALVENLIHGNFRGKVYPVHPSARSILGVKAYPTVEDIPAIPDLAVIAVPAPAVAAVLQACGRMGIRGAVVISAGFRECGKEGRAREESLIALAKAHGVSLIGPNCLGVINTDSQVGLNATFAKQAPKPGNISFLSQSGALGVYALEFAAAQDIGLRLFASLGNKAVVSENQLLQFFAQDPFTRVILAYLEELEAPGAFLELAAEIASGPDPKPIVLLKAGTSRSGRRAAASHTGALAESVDFLDDLCAQYGVVRAESLEDMFNLALCLSRQPLPRGRRLGIVTNAGGPAILSADEAERQGLELPETPGELRGRLAEFLPPAAGLANPIDMLGDANGAAYAQSLNVLLGSGMVDAALAICTPQRMTDMDDVAVAIAGRAGQAREAGVPLMSALAHFGEHSRAERILDDATVPNFAFAENAVRAMGAACRLGSWRRRGRIFPDFPALPVDRILGILRKAAGKQRSFLTEPESRRVLRACGFTLAKSALVLTKHGLRAGARQVGFPLVAKIVSPDILHKVDHGCVVTGIRDLRDLYRSYDSLLANAARACPGGARVDGVLLQAMVVGGVEVMLGAHRHPHFGPLIAFGLGGTLVEAIGDVRFRRAPLSGADGEDLLRGIRAAAVLGEFRGRPALDAAALRKGLFGLSRLMLAIPGIREVDLNPVFALERGALVADARIIFNPGAFEGI